MHEQALAIEKELGDRAGVAASCCNLGSCSYRTGDYGRARELYEQYRAICEAVGDRAGVAKACGNLGNCSLSTGDYGRAVSYYTEQYNMAKGLQFEKDEANAVMNMGLALKLEIRANVRGRAAGASQLPGSHSSALACGDEGVREAEKWLQTALDRGFTLARMHLAHLAFDTGRVDMALAHLQEYLSWCVKWKRNRCAGCHQVRSEDAQMLTCGGCRVARFCSADCQKMASKCVASGRWALLHGRHKDVCGVLGKWRQVVKDGMPPDSCRADLLAFLHR